MYDKTFTEEFLCFLIVLLAENKNLMRCRAVSGNDGMRDLLRSSREQQQHVQEPSKVPEEQPQPVLTKSNTAGDLLIDVPGVHEPNADTSRQQPQQQPPHEAEHGNNPSALLIDLSGDDKPTTAESSQQEKHLQHQQHHQPDMSNGGSKPGLLVNIAGTGGGGGNGGDSGSESTTESGDVVPEQPAQPRVTTSSTGGGRRFSFGRYDTICN